MPFGILGRVDLRMCIVDEGEDCPVGRDNFRGECGTAHYEQVYSAKQAE